MLFSPKKMNPRFCELIRELKHAANGTCVVTGKGK